MSDNLGRYQPFTILLGGPRAGTEVTAYTGYHSCLMPVCLLTWVCSAPVCHLSFRTDEVNANGVQRVGVDPEALLTEPAVTISHV